MNNNEVKISNDRQRCVSTKHTMITPDEMLPPENVNLLVLTNTGKLTIGKWSDYDCVAWWPLPARPASKKLQLTKD